MLEAEQERTSYREEGPLQPVTLRGFLMKLATSNFADGQNFPFSTKFLL